MSVFSNAKDRLIEQVALSYLNGTLLAPYGRATRLRIDSAAKTIDLEVVLKGEAAPLQIEITDYEIRKRGDRYFATLKEVRTSREWLTTLARAQLNEKRFELPPQVGRLLMRAL